MDELTIPEDLSTVENDRLRELADAARARVQELAGAENITADDADEAEALVSEIERIENTLAERTAEAEAIRERAAAAAARVAPAVEADAQDDADAAAADDTDADDDADVVDLTAGDADMDDDADAEPAAADREPVAVAASASKGRTFATPKRAASTAGLRAARGGVTNVRESDDAPRTTVGEFRATPQARAYAAGTKLDQRKLAEAITEVRHRFGNRIPDGVRDQVVIATAGVEYPGQTVSADAEHNYSIFRKAMASRASAAQALVASGGNPAPLPTVYDIFRVAEPQSPIENALPVVGAPRGGIKWLTPPALGEAMPGIGITTEAEDAAGYASNGVVGGTADKPFVTFTAPTEQAKEVTAVSQGVRFGNLGFRTFPEWVEDRLADLAVVFAQAKEELYLGGIDAGSVAVTHTTRYGAARGLIYSHLLAATKYRREQRMAEGAVLDCFMPSWVAELVYVDAINDHAAGMQVLLDNGAFARAWVSAKFRSFGLNIIYYADEVSASGQSFRAVQAAGALIEFPTTVVSYIHSPGTFVRLDAGTLEVGLYRDSSLNRTNDLEIFSEQWVEIAKVGIKSVKLTTTTIPNGTGPEPVRPIGVI